MGKFAHSFLLFYNLNLPNLGGLYSNLAPPPRPPPPPLNPPPPPRPPPRSPPPPKLALKSLGLP